MRSNSAIFKRSKHWNKRWLSPFTAPVPAPVRDALTVLQAERLHAILPLLCITIAANALAMAVAVLGDLPWWQQSAPPLIIVGGCVALLVRSRVKGCPASADAAYRQLQLAPFVTAGLGLVAGLWAVNAFTETEKFYCMVAPVFIGIAALISATCLLSVPRAAIAGMITVVAPMIIKMMLYDNLGVRAMAVMMIIVTLMQSGVVQAKFRETVAMLSVQNELNILAESDSLTGLDNRLAFMRKLEAGLCAEIPTLVALVDLDGFKRVNDTYGHQAGDAVLAEIANRMRLLAASALSVARLGGDEFALLFDVSSSDAQARDEVAAIHAAVPLPLIHGTAMLSVGASFGIAASVESGQSSFALLARADECLYADKAARRQDRVDRQVAA